MLYVTVWLPPSMLVGHRCDRRHYLIPGGPIYFDRYGHIGYTIDLPCSSTVIDRKDNCVQIVFWVSSIWTNTNMSKLAAGNTESYTVWLASCIHMELFRAFAIFIDCSIAFEYTIGNGSL